MSGRLHLTPWPCQTTGSRVVVKGASTKLACPTSPVSIVSWCAVKIRKAKVTGDRLVVAIDPGLGGTGLAVLRPDATIRDWCVFVNTGSNKTLPWEERATRLGDDLTFWLAEIGDVYGASGIHLVSEFPMKMESVAGIAAQKHSTMRLSYLVGVFAALLHQRWGWDMHTVTPQQWKGQLPKRIIEQRIARVLGSDQVKRLNLRSHAWDAVGIGLWTLGKL